MSLRRVVALLLLITVAASSVEVLIGVEATMVESPSAQAVGDAGGSPEPAGESGDDCACLCACVCAGAQLVVAPAAAPVPAGVDAGDAPAPDDFRSSTLPSPRPPHRPPVV